MAIVFRPSITGLDAVSTVSIDPTPNGLSIDANQVLSLALSSTSTTGALSSTDWNTFNGKQPAGNYITALTGDATATGPGSVALTLATVNGNVGSFGTATQTSTFTVNAKGLITAASNTSIQIAESQVTNLVSDLAAKQSTTLTNTHILVGNGSNVATDVALSGDATLANTGALTLATVNGNVGSFGTATQTSTFTVNGKGLITAASNTSIQITEAQVTNLTTDLAGKLTTTLTSAHLFVGNGSNVATDVALSGDATLSNTGALTLATVNSNTGSFGSSTSIPNFTVNGKGLITAAGSNVVIAPAGTLTGTTLAANVVTSSLTTVGTIGTGVWQGTAVAIGFGGTGQATKTAAFDALSPLTTKGDLIGFNSTNNVRVAASTDGTFVKYDSSAAAGLSSGTPASVQAYRSVTTTDAPSATTDAILVCSGASFTMTLPTAVGNTGKIFTIVHNGTSLTQLYTITTTSAQTISGGGVSTTSYIMYTVGERLLVVSNGANWIIIEHETKTAMSATAANTFTGTTTNPTKNGTPDVDLISWYRDGAYAVIHFRYQQTSNGTSGSGSYLIALPTNLTADTTEVPVQTSLTVGLGPVGRLEGVLTVSDGSNYTICGNANLYSSTQFRIWSRSSGGVDQYWASTSPWPLGGTVYAYGWVRIPMSGWNP